MAKAKLIEGVRHWTPYASLELSKEEAEFVRDLMWGCVGGDPGSSRRKVANAIEEALRIAGVDHTDMRDIFGTINCK